MVERLETIEPQLVNLLKSVAPKTRRDMVVLAIREAGRNLQVDSGLLSGAVEALCGGRKVDSEAVAQLSDFRDRLDDEYFGLQEETDSTGQDRNYMVPFSQARFVSAVLIACEDNSLENAMDAIYEALMAVGDRGHMVSSLYAAAARGSDSLE